MTESKEAFTFSGLGTIYSYTIVAEAPSGFEEFTPYVVALVKLKEGPMITAQLTDLNWEEIPRVVDGQERLVRQHRINIGDEVEMVTRILKKDGETGIITYGYKFRPRLKRSHVNPQTQR